MTRHARRCSVSGAAPQGAEARDAAASLRARRRPRQAGGYATGDMAPTRDTLAAKRQTGLALRALLALLALPLVLAGCGGSDDTSPAESARQAVADPASPASVVTEDALVTCLLAGTPEVSVSADDNGDPYVRADFPGGNYVRVWHTIDDGRAVESARAFGTDELVRTADTIYAQFNGTPTAEQDDLVKGCIGP